MGKIYPFPVKKKANNKHKQISTEQSAFLEELIEILIETYKEKIEDLREQQLEIRKWDGKTFKSPKEISKGVKEVNTLFLELGIKCNYFKFFTKENQEILYYHMSNTVYVVKNQNIEYVQKLSIGEFIAAFEGYPFSLAINEEVLALFEKQIEKLEITIEILNNTMM